MGHDHFMQQVNLGMIGGGIVGSGVFHHLQRNEGVQWQMVFRFFVGCFSISFAPSPFRRW